MPAPLILSDTFGKLDRVARVHWRTQHESDPGEQLVGIGAVMQRCAPKAFIEGGQPLPDAPGLGHLSEMCAKKLQGSNRITLPWHGSPHGVISSASRYGRLHAV